jgi:hypothetical protein
LHHAHSGKGLPPERIAGEGGDPCPKIAPYRILTEKNKRLLGGKGAMYRFFTLVYPVIGGGWEVDVSHPHAIAFSDSP